MPPQVRVKGTDFHLSTPRLGSGANGSRDVQAATFFEPLQFERVLARGYPPEWTPGMSDGGSGGGGEGEEQAGEEVEGSEDELGPLPVMTSDDEMEFAQATRPQPAAARTAPAARRLSRRRCARRPAASPAAVPRRASDGVGHDGEAWNVPRLFSAPPC